jgi:Na+-translocating ferredoxin:NAD+ oxidoreductase subunit G
MKENFLNSIIVLTIVCIVASGLLGFVYGLTKDRIDQQSIIIPDAQLKEIFPDANNFAQENDYFVIKKGDEIVGYAAIAQSQGYKSVIKIMVGIGVDKKIAGVRILEQSETPGLGTRIENANFYDKFKGLDSASAGLKKYNGKVDGITGATISSKAVSDGVVAIMKDRLEKLVTK